MSQWIVVDLDGTLCDVGHRVHLAQAGQWDEFHALCPHDKPVTAVVELVRALEKVHSIMVVSGRDERQLYNTEVWLKAQSLLKPDVILLRPKDDYRPDVELKTGLLENFFGGKEAVLNRVLFCLDDRDKVVEGLRNYGLTVFQVREGDY